MFLDAPRGIPADLPLHLRYGLDSANEERLYDFPQVWIWQWLRQCCTSHHPRGPKKMSKADDLFPEDTRFNNRWHPELMTCNLRDCRLAVSSVVGYMTLVFNVTRYSLSSGN